MKKMRNKKELSLKNFVLYNDMKLNNAIELGCGNGKDALWLSKKIGKKILAIDKEIKKNNDDKKIINVETDYFDVNKIGKYIKADKHYDLIYSSYSLCFNDKEQIINVLPFYFKKMKSGGAFYLLDFTSDEKIVSKRTNLWEIWFFDLIKKYFDHFEIRTKKVFEKEHGHTHHIFELVCFNPS